MEPNFDLITKPPLPFIGNKGKWIKLLYEYFKDNKVLKLNKNVIIVELFGGTGLLSILFKQLYPDNVVIYNDYDHYVDIVKDIDKIDALRIKIYNYVNNECKYPYNYKITNTNHINHIMNLIKHSGLDLNNPKILNIISSWLMFNGRIIKFEAKELYNRIPINNYIQKAEKYMEELKGIKIIHKDYKQVIDEFKNKNVFYILDPPYLSTSLTFYKHAQFWHLEDTVNLIDLCIYNKAILFESNKSEINALLEYMTKYKKYKYNISEDNKKIAMNENTEYFVLFNI